VVNYTLNYDVIYIFRQTRKIRMFIRIVFCILPVATSAFYPGKLFVCPTKNIATPNGVTINRTDPHRATPDRTGPEMTISLWRRIKRRQKTS